MSMRYVKMGEMRPRLLRSAVGPSTPDLEALMVRAGRGDASAFDQLYDEVAPLVYGVVRRVLRNDALAEEVSQEVFVEIWRVAARFDGGRGGVRGWVSTIAHRRAVDRVRSEQSRTDRERREHVPCDRSAAVDITEPVELAEGRAEVQRALATLTDLQREAVALAYYEGNTYREVAALLDAPEGTIKTRIRDGLTKLRAELEGQR